jgi:uncharacterized protein (DUF2062 family)
MGEAPQECVPTLEYKHTRIIKTHEFSKGREWETTVLVWLGGDVVRRMLCGAVMLSVMM